VWDARDRSLALSIPAPVSVMTARVLFGPRDDRLVVSLDTEYSLWDLKERRLIGRYLRDDVSEIPGPAAFTRDGKTLAFTPTQRTLRLIDLETGEELVTLRPPDGSLPIHLEFSEDGAMLASIAAWRGLQVWDLRSLRRELASVRLDWSRPPFADAPAERSQRPLRVEVDLGDLERSP
jgi:WD40 repeat protein